MEKKKPEPFPLRVMAWLFPRLEKYAPLLAKKLFVHVFFTPAKYPYPDKEKEYLETAVKSKIIFKGREVQVYQWGEGIPVLMIHGWMGRATQFRKFVGPFNKAGYAVVSFDAPAHGRSGGAKSHLMYFVQVAEELLKKYKFRSIIGHSLGGVAGLHVVYRGAVIPKIIMIGSPAIADEIIGEYLRRLNGSWKLGRYFKEYIHKTYNQPFEYYTASYIIQFIQNQPLLLIYDEDDIEVKMVHGDTLHELYPVAEFARTRGLGHTRILKDEGVIQQCLDFIRQ